MKSPHDGITQTITGIVNAAPVSSVQAKTTWAAACVSHFNKLQEVAIVNQQPAHFAQVN